MLRNKRPQRRGRRPSGSDVFAAVADATRRKLIDLIAEQERPVHELARRFAASRPAVSRHLRVLRQARIVTVRLVGRERVYGLRAGSLDAAAQWIRQYDRFWTERLAALGQVLDREAP